jgi:hypothetical protein
VLFIIIMVAMVGGGAALGDEAAFGAAMAGGMCLVLPIFLVLIIAISLIIGIVYQLALRYGVLEDVTFGQAIKRGWDDLWAKRGAFVMYLVMILPGLAAGLVMLVFMLPFMVPAIAFVFAEKYVMAGAMFVLMALAMLLPTAVYGTFISSAWTVFFRQMTGKEPTAKAVRAPVPQAPYYAQAPVAPVADVPAQPVTEQAAPAPEVSDVETEPVAATAEPPAEEAPPADA